MTRSASPPPRHAPGNVVAFRSVPLRPVPPPDIHPMGCTCREVCAPDAGLAQPAWSAADVTCIQIVAGFVLGLVLCEIFALLTGGPHITVIFGGAS